MTEDLESLGITKLKEIAKNQYGIKGLNKYRRDNKDELIKIIREMIEDDEDDIISKEENIYSEFKKMKVSEINDYAKQNDIIFPEKRMTKDQKINFILNSSEKEEEEEIITQPKEEEVTLQPEEKKLVLKSRAQVEIELLEDKGSEDVEIIPLSEGDQDVFVIRGKDILEEFRLGSDFSTEATSLDIDEIITHIFVPKEYECEDCSENISEIYKMISRRIISKENSLKTDHDGDELKVMLQDFIEEIVNESVLGECCKDEIFKRIENIDPYMITTDLYAPRTCVTCGNSKVGDLFLDFLGNVKEDYDASTLAKNMNIISDEDENTLKSSTLSRVLTDMGFVNECCRMNMLGKLRIKYPDFSENELPIPQNVERYQVYSNEENLINE